MLMSYPQLQPKGEEIVLYIPGRWILNFGNVDEWVDIYPYLKPPKMTKSTCDHTCHLPNLPTCKRTGTSCPTSPLVFMVYKGDGEVRVHRPIARLQSSRELPVFSVLREDTPGRRTFGMLR